MMFVRLLFLLLLVAPLGVTAAETPADIDFRYETWHSDYRLNEDGSGTATYTSALTVLKERAIEGIKRSSISYSTSVEKAEVIEAYTRKADGRRIVVPKDNFQVEENKGRNGAAPLFSDYNTLSVVFPDVAVGDTVVMTWRITQAVPIFPGHFSEAANFYRHQAWDDVVVRIDYPAALPVHYAAREMAEHTEAAGARKIVEWRYANKQPLKSERHDWSVYDPESDPGFAFSTFDSYAAIAEAYGLRARPKAAVTERVRKLAEEITAGRTQPRDQAQALYDWVATNITYGGNCIGVGAVVPHDTDFVIENRMGDCKDHATLLQALLAARGIKSIQALVNAGSLYRLPRIPLVSAVNHVINYLPELDLYLDSTAETIPFGLLPPGDAGKPVLWVDGYREGTTTPVSRPGENRQQMKTVARIAEDGSITGSVEVVVNGDFGAGTRAWMRDIPKDREEELIKAAFRQHGHLGTGTLEKPEGRELRSNYQYKVKFEMKDFIQRPGAGGFAINPLVFSLAPVGSFVSEAVEPLEQVDVACSNGISTEEYELQLPKGMKLLSVPDNVSLANDFLAYKATYKVKGNTLSVRRVFDDRTPGRVCSPAVMAAYKKLASRALADLRSQVLYK